MPTRLRLGINTCFATKRWPEPQRWASIVADHLGLVDCQVTLDLFDPGLDPQVTGPYAEAVAHAALQAGLHLHSTFTGLQAYSGNLLVHPDATMRAAAERWFLRAIEVTARLGARGTGGFLGALSVADAAEPPRRAQMLHSLGGSMERLSNHASRVGLEFLLFENMAVGREPGFCIEEAAMLEARGNKPAMRGNGAPWVLCLDLGHPCALPSSSASADPLAWIAAKWRWPPVLQIQQSNRDGDHHWPFTAEHNRAGLLHATATIEALMASGWEGDIYLFLEVIHPHEHPDAGVLADLEQSVAYWRKAIDAVGASSA